MTRIPGGGGPPPKASESASPKETNATPQAQPATATRGAATADGMLPGSAAQNAGVNAAARWAGVGEAKSARLQVLVQLSTQRGAAFEASLTSASQAQAQEEMDRLNKRFERAYRAYRRALAKQAPPGREAGSGPFEASSGPPRDKPAGEQMQFAPLPESKPWLVVGLPVLDA